MAKLDTFCNRAAACEAHDDVPRSPGQAETIVDIIVRRYSRHQVMRGTLGVAATALFGTSAFDAGRSKAEPTRWPDFDPDLPPHPSWSSPRRAAAKSPELGSGSRRS